MSWSSDLRNPVGLGAPLNVLDTYNVDGLTPAITADFAKGTLALGGDMLAFNDLLTYERDDVAWKLNALGHWVEVPADTPRTGHHVWKDGKLVPAGIAVCASSRTNHVSNSEKFETTWASTDVTITANTHVSPDGTMSADTLTRSGEQGYLIKSSAGVNGQTKSIHARTVTGTGTVGLLSHNSVPASEVALTEEWQRFDMPVDTAETGGSNFYAVDFRVGDLDEIVVWGAQLEDGPYPTDYIATENVSVSTNPETLTIDAVSVAKAIGVFGPELIANNDFSDDLTGWVSASDGILSVTSDGLLSVANLPDDLAGFATQQFATELDELYLVEIDIANVTNRRVAGVGTSASGDRNLLDFGINDQVGKFSGFFTGTGGNVHIQLASFDLGATTLYRSATVRKVTMPDALSFVVKGYMTYEDEDAFSTVRVLTLDAGSDDKISYDHSTNGVDTGQMFFIHRVGGVSDNASTSDTDKAPGVHVPFSYASRHSSTSVRGASDGVLTPGKTPSGVPNILGHDLEIATIGNLIISELHVFADYLSNDGLIEASSTN
ncbi:tail protein [Phage MedPE-SWcel-C56]|uniref:Uncharacterized protein n=1 Tax=Phage MedPE-SWcel-C56 TaxID=1871314 RepID=A0A1B1IY50_9CAUD|nr:tail protein [Phage MedPE-SWcel-C56]ANS06246.1 hypothetical protein [Phage MedPE-SWcel-C56]